MQYLQISDQISKMFWLKNKFKNIKQTNYVKVHAYTYKKIIYHYATEFSIIFWLCRPSKQENQQTILCLVLSIFKDCFHKAEGVIYHPTTLYGRMIYDTIINVLGHLCKTVG